MEKEFKLLLSGKEYRKILSCCNDEPKLQTNYYFLIDAEKGNMVRARRKGESFELTCKRLVKAQNGVFLSRETNLPLPTEAFNNIMAHGIAPELCAEFFSLDCEYGLSCLGSMDTLRAKFDFFGCEIELDKNDYLFTTDFELEFECESDRKIELLKSKLTEMGIDGRQSTPKSHRFSQRKRFLESKNYECVLFDFDGTLCDTQVGIVNSLVKTCAKFGLDVSGQDLRRFFGPPVTEIYNELVGADKTAEARSIHRELYATESYKMNEVYAGIAPLLKTLKERSVELGIATARSEDSARQISDFWEIGKHFDFIFGMKDFLRENKIDIIRDAICASAKPKQSIVMVGDRFYDVEGAQKNGIDGIAVLYGYGTEDEFEDYQNIAAVKTVAELTELLGMLCCKNKTE